MKPSIETYSVTACQKATVRLSLKLFPGGQSLFPLPFSSSSLNSSSLSYKNKTNPTKKLELKRFVVSLKGRRSKKMVQEKKPTHREGFLILSPLYLLLYIVVLGSLMI